MRRLAVVPLLALLLFSSGCEFGRQWFQMSSDSPMPFFGIDLLPRRSSTRPINAGSDDTISIQTADDRGSNRTAFEPRILPTRPKVFEPAELPREAIEIPELHGRSTSTTHEATPHDGFGDPFPEAIELR